MPRPRGCEAVKVKGEAGPSWHRSRWVKRCAFLATIPTTRVSPRYLRIRLWTKEMKSTAADRLCGWHQLGFEPPGDQASLWSSPCLGFCLGEHSWQPGGQAGSHSFPSGSLLTAPQEPRPCWAQSTPCAQGMREGRFLVLFRLFKLIKPWTQPFGDSRVCTFSSQGWKPRRNVVYKDKREPSTGESLKGCIIHPYSYLDQLLSGVYDPPPPPPPRREREALSQLSINTSVAQQTVQPQGKHNFPVPSEGLLKEASK